MIPVWPYIWYVSEISWLQIYDDYELLDYEYAGPEKRLTSIRKDVGRDLVVFFGVAWHYLWTFCVCNHEIIFFVTYERANFVVFDLPLENKIYTLFEKTS